MAEQPDHVQDDEYGSYMAYLKIQQDVEAFERLIREMGLNSSDKAKMWLLGRTPEGVLSVPAGGIGDNGFDYCHDAQGTLCPAAAHIRKANQRTNERL